MEPSHEDAIENPRGGDRSLASGVTLKEKKNAVKTTIEGTPPNPTSHSQFFQVKFGE